MPYWQVIAIMACSLLGEGPANEKAVMDALKKAQEVLRYARIHAGIDPDR